VRVAVQKIPGVEEVKVSLNEGMTEIRFARANGATISQVRRAIREKGFTPKEADVRVRGRVDLSGDTFLLVLPDSVDTFTLHASPAAREQLREAIDREVEAQGRVPEESERVGAARILEVKSIKSPHDN
jgi:copper chaperone CopZ